jgi:hypothetical protein
MATPTPENAIYKYTKTVAQTAYIFGFPAVVQYVAMTNDIVDKAAMNVMYYSTGLCTPTYSPFINGGHSTDVLYTTAWLDLTNTAIILKTPDTRSDQRWFTIQLIDAYSNVIKNEPGDDKRRKAKKYLLIGPNSTLNDLNPNVPDDIKIINCATNIVYLIGRVAVYGSSDLTAATTIMNGITIQETIPGAAVLSTTPLTSSIYTSLDYFTTLMTIINYNSYSRIEEVMITLFKTIGLNPAVTFNPSALSTNVQDAYNEAISVAYEQIIPFGYKYAKGVTISNNWSGGTKLGIWCNDYLRRAYGALNILAANVVTEQFYAVASKDVGGDILDTSINNYKIHFTVPQLPTYNETWGFFSITLYEITANGLQFYDNAENKYSIGSNTGELTFNIDDTLDIYIQHDTPTDPLLEPNWIPAPLGNFVLIYRIYAPTFTQINNFVAPGIELNII